MGTIVCVSGAMLLSFYHGHIIGLGESKIHWTYAQRMGETSSSTKLSSFIGPLFVILSTLGWAFWFIIQARVGESFPAPYTSTTLMCLMASFECGIIAVIADHKVASWWLKDPTRLIASLYAHSSSLRGVFSEKALFTCRCLVPCSPLLLPLQAGLCLRRNYTFELTLWNRERRSIKTTDYNTRSESSQSVTLYLYATISFPSRRVVDNGFEFLIVLSVGVLEDSPLAKDSVVVVAVHGI
ncbi:hypothetical protein DVH24_015063 [Malus domestica]|uniref:WAT1-related protein n=1 Tax=Malus domestica TaxID=3750 RepID=A0A498K619_MALDO|nr:hypothetical protein DVH24_015063 [Malus domestica]